MKTNLIYKSILTVLTIGGLFILVGCGGNNNSSTTASCPANTTYYNGACYTGQGTYVTNSSLSFSNGFYADSYSRTSKLQITNSSLMTNFFKYAMGVCDRAGGYNGGQASCQSYLSGHMDMILQFATNGSNSALATFIAQPTVNPVFNYSAQLPSGWGLLGLAIGYTTGVFLPDPKQYYGVYRNPLQIEMQVSLINNSAGFSANSYGASDTPYWNNKITIEVASGKKEDWNLNYVMKIDDVNAIQGTMARCRTINCGLY